MSLFKPLLIRDVCIDPGVVPAPLCSISDRAWRILSREQGCALAFTQMVSSEALTHEHRKSWKILDIEGEEGPVAVQLFGHNPESLSRSALEVEKAGATIVDFNIGCPSRKIVNSMGGAGLIKQPDQVRDILKEMRRVLTVPLTVKLRAGWDQYGEESFEIARIAEDEGVDAVTLHARTRTQGFKGEADWTIIAALKERIRIPVIGNGDVKTPDDAERMIRQTGCDGVMLGRAIIGNVWVLGRICARLRGDPEPAPPTLPQRIAMMHRHARLMSERRGIPLGLIEFRKHAVQYLKGIRGSHVVKMALMNVKTLAELQIVLDQALERSGETGFDEDALDETGLPTSTDSEVPGDDVEFRDSSGEESH